MDFLHDKDINNVKLTVNFNLREFECPCCRRVIVHRKLLTVLQLTREHLGREIVINSGYRCDRHNLYIGGWEFSKHMEGKAVDIKLPSESYTQDLLAALGEYQQIVNWEVHTTEGYVHVELIE